MQNFNANSFFLQIIEGQATRHNSNNIYMSWESPLTGEKCEIQGDLDFVPQIDESGEFYLCLYEHVVFDNDDNQLYKVVSQPL